MAEYPRGDELEGVRRAEIILLEGGRGERSNELGGHDLACVECDAGEGQPCMETGVPVPLVDLQNVVL